MFKRHAIYLLTLILLISGCSITPEPSQTVLVVLPEDELLSGETAALSTQSPPAIQPTVYSPNEAQIHTKIDLWQHGPHLRGANIYQRRIYPELDGASYMGTGLFGPPYTLEDFERLAALGANYVNLSHPGLFAEEPPYALDPDVQQNLDDLLSMAAAADLFAVISFRTGPGRSEFTFFWGDEDDWFSPSYYNDQVWEDPAAQDAWVEMWRYTAQRYCSNPIVVGYDLMVEPNSNDIFFDEWDPEQFYERYAESLYDWNPLAGRISEAVRQSDSVTPILVGGNGYSSLSWLPYIVPSGDQHTVYTFHQYAPHQYTHQYPQRESIYTYPGQFDLDWDGQIDQFDHAWLEEMISVVDQFRSEYGYPVAVNEFGIVRWAPQTAAFLDDEIALFEARAINHALWVWADSWPEQAENDAFNFRHGPNPKNHQNIDESEYLAVIRKYWSRNLWRPSNTSFDAQ